MQFNYTCRTSALQLTTVVHLANITYSLRDLGRNLKKKKGVKLKGSFLRN